MKILTAYKVKIKKYRHIFDDTARIYRDAVDYLIKVCMSHWDDIVAIQGGMKPRKTYVEKLIHRTKKNIPSYDFDVRFYKFPSYLRRSAIAQAIGKVSSYKSNYANWEAGKCDGRPSPPKAGHVFPALYRDNMYKRIDEYHASVKVYHNNDWVWLDVDLNKGDADYIEHHCTGRTVLSPTLMREGKEWFLQFSFEEMQDLYAVSIFDTRILAVDLGINNACVCCVMEADGTIVARRFLKLATETDSLQHALKNIKRAQKHGAGRMPRLWARAKGINHDISSKTAEFITNVAIQFGCHVIVFEHLGLNGKKRGSNKQKLHMWKANDVQSIVTNKAHRAGIRIARVCAWGTSKYAFDGSGKVVRDKDNYSMCTFATGKRYHADLSASYNIGARYFIREITKTLPETVRLQCEADVPRICKRSTCTWNDLISLCAALEASAIENAELRPYCPSGSPHSLKELAA